MPALLYVAVFKIAFIPECVWTAKNYIKIIASTTLNACPDAAWAISALTLLNATGTVKSTAIAKIPQAAVAKGSARTLLFAKGIK